jgi:hypothetical protein
MLRQLRQRSCAQEELCALLPSLTEVKPFTWWKLRRHAILKDAEANGQMIESQLLQAVQNNWIIGLVSALRGSVAVGIGAEGFSAGGSLGTDVLKMRVLMLSLQIRRCDCQPAFKVSKR